MGGCVSSSPTRTPAPTPRPTTTHPTPTPSPDHPHPIPGPAPGLIPSLCLGLIPGLIPGLVPGRARGRWRCSGGGPGAPRWCVRGGACGGWGGVNSGCGQWWWPAGAQGPGAGVLSWPGSPDARILPGVDDGWRAGARRAWAGPVTTTPRPPGHTPPRPTSRYPPSRHGPRPDLPLPGPSCSCPQPGRAGSGPVRGRFGAGGVGVARVVAQWDSRRWRFRLGRGPGPAAAVTSAVVWLLHPPPTCL